jgi:hypothetical protein
MVATEMQSPEFDSPRRRSVAFAPDVNLRDSDEHSSESGNDPNDRQRPEVTDTMGHANQQKDMFELGSKSEGPLELQLKALIEGQKSLQKELQEMRNKVGADTHELEVLRQAQQTCENPPPEPLPHHMDCQPHEHCNSPLAIQQQQQDLFQHFQQDENGEAQQEAQQVPSAMKNLGYGMDVVQVVSDHVSSHARSLKSHVDANTLRVRRVSRGCC